MKLSFGEWLLKEKNLKESDLTAETMINKFGLCGNEWQTTEEEANGYIQNYHDEYGDYLRREKQSKG